MSLCVVLFKQKTAYEMRISDWSSDVCSSDLAAAVAWRRRNGCTGPPACRHRGRSHAPARRLRALTGLIRDGPGKRRPRQEGPATILEYRSEEHTSELQSLMRRSYAVFCLKTNTTTKNLIATQIRGIIKKYNISQTKEQSNI